MKRMMMTLAVTALFAGAAQAQTSPAPATAPAAAPPAAAALPPIVVLASIAQPGETFQPGEIVSAQRPFASWILVCDRRISTGKQICSMMQTVKAGDQEFVQTRLAQDVNAKMKLIFNMVGASEQGDGPSLKIGALDKKFDKAALRCMPQGCIGVIDFDKPIVDAMQNLDAIKVTFATAQNKKIEASVPLAGFGAAFQAALNDPLGLRPLAQAGLQPAAPAADAAPAQAAAPAAKPAKPALKK